MFQLPTRTIAKLSELGKDKLISGNGWSDCCQECNAFKPHRKRHDYLRVSWHVITGRYGGVAEITLSHLRKSESIKSQHWSKEFEEYQ